MLIFSTFSLKAQFKIDSLRQALQAATGTERVDLLNELVSMVRISEPDAAMASAEEAMALSEALNYDKGLIMVKINIATMLSVRNEYDQSIGLVKEALFLAEQIDYEEGIFNAHFILGGFYTQTGEYEIAVRESVKALNYAEYVSDPMLTADLLNNIGRVQQILQRYDEAEKNFAEAIALCEKHKLEFRKGPILINMALLAYLQGDLNTSIDRNMQALSIFEKYDDKMRTGIALNNLGFAFFEQNEYDEALRYYGQALVIRRELNNLSGVAKIQLNMAKVYHQRGDIKKSLGLIKISLGNAEDAKNAVILQEVREFAYKLYQENKMYQQAFEMYRSYSVMKDSLFSIEKRKAVDEIVAKFENEKLRSEKEAALQEGLVKDLEIRQRNYALVVVVIVGLVAILIFNRRKLLYKHEVTLNKLHLLRSQFRPHFIFNVLNSIHNSVLKGNTDEASEYLTEFAHLMRQDLDAYDESEVSLKEELASVEAYLHLEKLRFKEQLTFDIQVAENIDTDQNHVLPMLLQPLVENAIKHGFEKPGQSGHIDIKVFKDKDFLGVDIVNNGAGLDEKTDDKHQSKGLELVRERLRLKDKRNTLILEDMKGLGVRSAVKIRLT